MSTDTLSVADMLRKTAKQTSDILIQTTTHTTDFYLKMADHIDKLESTIKALETQISDLESLATREYDDHK